MDTDTIDRLFLELSQFTKAKTKKELKLINLLERLVDATTAHINTPEHQQRKVALESRACDALLYLNSQIDF